ncbi:brevican core protein-like [Branchiostoma lanceolatum]|uniref:brevican core protein-like n=1 Tax=Branchiostoma lanceolatum TaxID=7740 RepID=UPI003456076F
MPIPNLPPPRQLERMKVSDTKESPEKESEQEDRPYEDVDGSANAMLCSGLQRAVPNLPPPRHPERMKVSDTKESPEKEPEQEDRKYEYADPHGESIFGPSSGLQRAVPTLPPPRRHELMEASDTNESPEKEPEQEDRKYEYVDPHGESITGPSSGLQRAVPTLPPPRRRELMEASDTKESPEKEPEQEDRKYEDVEGGANAMLGSELQRAVPTETSPPHLDMGDHVVVCPEFNEDTSHDSTYTQEDTDRSEESGAPCADNKAGARKTEGGPVALPDSQDDPETSGIRNVNERQQPGDTGTDDSTSKTADCNSSGLIPNAMYMPGTLRQVQPCQDELWREYKDHCYKLFRIKRTFFVANKKCKQLGANLASATNAEENNFIARVISDAPKGLLRHAVWFGLRRRKGHWTWTDGSPLSYTNWAPGEPGKNFILRTATCANVYSKEEHLLIEETEGENSVGPAEE